MRSESALTLSESDKKVLEMHNNLNMTFRDIANELGISKSNASFKYKRANSILKELDFIDKCKKIDSSTIDDTNLKYYAYAHLSTRAYNCLARYGKLVSVSELTSMTDNDIWHIKGIGINSYTEIKTLIKVLSGDDIEEKFNFNDEDIDPEMLDIIKNFNRAGVETLFCCQGHVNYHDGVREISIPYISSKYPTNEKILILIMNSISKYHMLKLEINNQFPFEIDDENMSGGIDNYIDKVNTFVDRLDTVLLDIRMHPVGYNFPDDIYDNDEYVEKIFESSRKRFMDELRSLSNEIYATYSQQHSVKRYYK